MFSPRELEKFGYQSKAIGRLVGFQRLVQSFRLSNRLPTHVFALMRRISMEENIPLDEMEDIVFFNTV